MADETLDPTVRSAAQSVMMADWQLIRDVRAGASAVRGKGIAYLRKWDSESDKEYAARVQTAPYSAHYEDATRTLAAKPFSDQVKLQGQVPAEIASWAENIDYAGNDLHNVAKTLFDEALHLGVVFLYVDHTQTGDAKSLGEERRLGARPYFRIIPTDQMLAIYTGLRNGKTYIRQIRFLDNETKIDGLKEVLVERVRQVDDIDGKLVATLYVKGKDGWATIEDQIPLKGAKLEGIPVVPILFGLKLDHGPYSVKPPMVDLAHKQIEHYQHANRLDNIFDFAGFPMLQGEGMAPPTTINEAGERVQVPIQVGPRAVLFAPPAQQGDKPRWSFIEPGAQTIKEVREHLKDLESVMRTLGLQPLMPTMGIQNMAATTSAINAARTHSAVQAWAFTLKDGLEQAFVYMAQWVGLAVTTEVNVKTDFAAEVLKDADEKLLLEMVTLGYISWDTFVDEMMRRDLLGPSFDKETERQRRENMESDPLGMGTGITPDPDDDDDDQEREIAA